MRLPSIAIRQSRLRRTGRARQPMKRNYSRRLNLERLEDRCLLSRFTLGSLVQVEPADPFAGSHTGNQGGVNYPATQVEPRLAVDPTNANHLVGAWHQDRWDNGGAQGIVAGVSFDGGQTWQDVVIPGLTTASGGKFDRASDPWVSFGPTGKLFVSNLVFPVDSAGASAETGVTVSTSTDGGLTWNEPSLVILTKSYSLFNDKESINADPYDPNLVCVIWDQLNLSAAPSATPTLFSRSTDGGQTWSAPQVIFQSPANETNIDHQIVVLPNGTLIDAFSEINGPSGTTSLEILRSSDHGVTWSPPIVAAQEMTNGAFDPFNTHLVRGGSGFAEIAVDPASGNVYAVWEDGRFNRVVAFPQPDSVAFSMSSDGGVTWSTPIPINQTPINASAPLDDQAFTPSIAVGAGGLVAVTYYDFRYQGSIPGATTDCWAVIGDPQGTGGLTNPTNWGNELRLTATSFNLLNAPVAQGWFLGDYEGVAPSGNNFVASFAQAGSSFPASGIFSRQILLRPGSATSPPISPSIPMIVNLSPVPAISGFAAPASYLVDQGPVALAVGDFNNDGFPDLVTANRANNDLSILLGNGDGTFPPAMNIPVGGIPLSLAVGDFNGDGRLDIVVVTLTFPKNQPLSYNLNVLLGNGDGTFQKPQTIALPNVIGNQAPQQAQTVAMGDLNGDGKPDLIVGARVNLNGNKGYVDVLLGRGDGTFQTASITPINSSNPQSIVVADVNGDGKQDVVIAGGLGVSILLGNGDGTLKETTDAYPGVFGFGLAVGDLNGDHIPDLVVDGSGTVNGTQQVVQSVLFGNGDGTFQAPRFLVTGLGTGFSGAVAVGDFNHDGKLDIVTANESTNYPNPGTIGVFLGNGNGTFQAPLTFNSGVANPVFMVAADLNRDGFPDLALLDRSTNNVVVLLNSAAWPAPTMPAAPPLTPSSSSVIPTTNSTVLTSQNPAPLQSATAPAGADQLALDEFFAALAKEKEDEPWFWPYANVFAQVPLTVPPLV